MVVFSVLDTGSKVIGILRIITILGMAVIYVRLILRLTILIASACILVFAN
jgi:hypothetical protein